jgi:hypothetical protein
MRPAQIHNRNAAAIVRQIVQPARPARAHIPSFSASELFGGSLHGKSSPRVVSIG